MVALVEAVVVVQADALDSGTHQTAELASRVGTPLWVVPVAPWAGDRFGGSLDLLAKGARPFVGIPQFLRAVGLSEEAALPAQPAPLPDDPLQRRVLAALSLTPLHRDGIAERAELTAGEVGAALFGLILGGHVVETSDGRFRVALGQSTRTA
jgi:predicted Rossmann fold nucleotide-binding protein DprA/Smf involved in DNA uptake